MDDEGGSDRRGAAVALWGLLQVAFADTFLFHDSWKHQFPVLFSVVRQMTCGPLPQWIPTWTAAHR